MVRFLLGFVACLVISAISKAADVFDFETNSAVSSAKSERIGAKPVGTIAGKFSQKIDHFGKLSGQKFAQRYWINSTFASRNNDAPVIYHICGEIDAETGYFLTDYVLEWAKILGAHVVFLEHRYYGKSFPFGDLSTDHLRFLTLDNIIEDLAHFQRSIAARYKFHGKWLAVGGSYSATLAAIYRLRHPELIVGALASSAPMISGIGQMQNTPEDVEKYSSIELKGEFGRAWIFQACTTFGFWWSKDNKELISPSPELCRILFPKVKLVNYGEYNRHFYFPFISSTKNAPTNILFTYGTADVWTRLGLSKKNNKNKNISILSLRNAGHHEDLNAAKPTDSDEIKSARVRFIEEAKKWLNPKSNVN
jgi:pimeloyl-ACP methyl ester carboxylesterase